MSYGDYVFAAYAVFAVVLLWDYVVPRMRIARLRRETRRQAARRSTASVQPTGDLQR